MKINHYLIFLVILLSVTTNSYSQKLSELVAKNDKAIFQIFSYDEYGSPYSTGTGFFINPQGKALTNFHVLEDVKYAFIRDINGKIHQIREINRICEPCDIAEFTIENLGDTNAYLDLTYEIPPKASEIFVIGNPKGLESTVSTGIISSIRNNVNKVIQITAPISPGSSGSPIMDMKGKVIGIATYGYKEGQNLNFGYWIGCKDKLEPNNKLTISTNESGNFYVINEVCKTENNLILNSIEFNEKNTVVNMSFTNTSLVYGDGAFIFTVIGDQDQSFVIQDNNTGQKYFLYNSTLGISAKSPTTLKLGETKRFKLYFPPISNTQSISISEGMQGSDWSFKNIELESYKSIKFEDKNYFNDFYLQTGLTLLSKKDFVNAYVILKDFVSSNSDNAYCHNLAGIVSHILGNNLDAFMHINEAIEINPTDDNLYFNLYYLNVGSENFNEALKNISVAIQLESNQPEYYYYRAEIYFLMELWEEAINDYSKFIDSDRTIPYSTYFNRGIAKIWMEDKSACKDFYTAQNKCDNESDRKMIYDYYEKFCME